MTDVASDGTNQDCLSEDVIAAFVEGRLSVPQRNAVIAHLSCCGECRREVAAVQALLLHPAVAREIELASGRGQRSRFSRRAFITGISAAACIAIVMALPRAARQTQVHRGPTIEGSDIPALFSPAGDVAEMTTFTWSLVSGVDLYRITLFDADGRVVLESESTDTTLVMPDSVSLIPGRSYLWKVEARTGIDRWTASDLVEFRVHQATHSMGQPLDNGASLGTVPQIPARDSLHTLALHVPPAVLVTETRIRPSEVREGIATALALASRGGSTVRRQQLDVARRLAAAYETAWNDAYLSRQVAKVSGWSSERLAEKVAADSVRGRGAETYATSGAAAAAAVWRRSAARSNAIGDTAGLAASLGNIGAALARDGRTAEASATLERTRSLAAAIGDMRVEANAMSELAGLIEERDADGARKYYAQAVTLHRRIGDSRGLAADFNNIAALAQAAGDAGEARRQLEAALQINQRDGRTQSVATNFVNLAALAALDGEFGRGTDLYRAALKNWRTGKHWPDLADGLRGLANLEVRRGDYASAELHLTEAYELYARTGPFADVIAVMQELAVVRAAQGDLQSGIDRLQRAARMADSAGAEPVVRAAIALARGDLARQLNVGSQADAFYADAERLYRIAGDRAGVGEAQQGRGLQQLDKGNFVRAGELFTAAMRTQRALGDRRSAAITQMMRADVSMQRGDTVTARRELKLAALELEQVGDRAGAAAATGERAMLETAAGLPAAGEALYRSALRTLAGRNVPAVTWTLHAGLARTRIGQGAIDEGARELRAAIDDVERSAGFFALAERRSSFFSDKWDVYADLSALEQRRGRTAAAFDVSERLRAGEMKEILASGRITSSEAGGRLAAREQDLRRQIAELNGTNIVTTAQDRRVRGPDVSRTSPVAREALLRAEREYSDLLTEMREAAPRHNALVAPAAVSWRQVAARLPGDQVLIEYLLSDSSSSAFVISRDTIVAFKLDVDRHELARRVDFIRGTLTPRGSSRLDSLWRAPLHQMYRDVIEPIEATGILKNKKRIVFVPHAELHYLPFAALMTGNARTPYLVQQYEITTTPSAAVWLTIGQRAVARGTRGVLALAPESKSLPSSVAEARAAARLAGGPARVKTGTSATEAEFRRSAGTARVIHLATYGVLNKQNPLFSYVQLAPEGANNGRLEAYELFGLKLSADLVVLAACQTGLASGARSDVPAGDDWVGLARGFLSAGAAQVMGSLWPVADQATGVLMEQFYRSYGESSNAASALAAAQRHMITTRGTESPYYWAAFELVGGS